MTRVGLDFYVIQFGDEREPHEQNKKREREVYVKSVENEFWVYKFKLGITLNKSVRTEY